MLIVSAASRTSITLWTLSTYYQTKLVTSENEQQQEKDAKLKWEQEQLPEVEQEFGFKDNCENATTTKTTTGYFG